MGKNYNGVVDTPKQAVAEISLTFDVTRFNEKKVLDAIQKQIDGHAEIVCRVDRPKKISFTRRSITVTSEWSNDSSSMSFSKWSSAIHIIAKAIFKSIKEMKDTKLIECKVSITDRRDGSKTTIPIVQA